MRRIQENWHLNIILKFINNQPVIENSLINIFFINQTQNLLKYKESTIFNIQIHIYQEKIK